MTGRGDDLYDGLIDLESSAPVGGPPLLQGRRRRLAWLVTGGLAAAAALAIGVYLGGGAFTEPMVGNPESPTATLMASPTARPTDPSSPSPTMTPAPPASTAAPTPSATAQAAGWRESPFIIGDEGSLGALSFDDQLGLWMMVEGHRNLDDEGAAGLPVVTSTTGTDWTTSGSVPLDEVPDPTGFVRVGRIVRSGSELYLSGVHVDSTNAITPLAWTSMDGREWRPSPTGMPVGEYGTAEVIASNGERLLADVGERDGTHVWTSTDGWTWTEADVPSNGRPVGIMDAYADADGFVLAGHVLETDSTWVPAIWTSPDGIRWTAAASLPEGGGSGWAVTRGPDGSYVAALELDGAPTRLMSSIDGRVWSTMLEIGAPDEHPHGLDGSAGGIVYMGRHDGAHRVYSWIDSAGWRELTPPAAENTGYAFFALSVGSTGWVAVGTQAGTDQPGVEILPPVLLAGEFAD